MKIAVTGSQGQLGQELCRRLGSQAIPLDLPDFDLTQAQVVQAALQQHQPQVVINAAAYTQVDKAEELSDLCWQVNAHGVSNLAEACQQIGCKLIQISTDYVFGFDGRTTPYREDDPTSAQGVYAESKLAGESQAHRCEQHFVVRTCGLYGRPGANTPGNFVETMLRLGQERDHLRIVNDQHCTPSYVNDVATALLFLAGTEAYGTYHVVNQGHTTWYGFAQEIFQAAGIEITVEPITSDQYPLAAPRPTYSVLDTTKYHALGGPQMPTWQQALAAYLATRQTFATEKA